MNAGPGPLAVVLAGGLSRRLGGGDKGALPLGAGRLLDAVIARLSLSCRVAGISLNGDPARLSLPPGIAVLPDPVAGHPGPLAGVLAALALGRARGEAAVLTAPCDTPFLPADLGLRLAQAGPGIAMAMDAAGRLQGTLALWPVAAEGALAAYLAGGGRKVTDFARAHALRPVAFPPATPDPFLNVNTPEDLRAARAAATAP